MQVQDYEDEILQKINNIYGVAEAKETIINYSKYIKLVQDKKIVGLGNANILIKCPDNFKNDTDKLIDLLYYILKSNKATDNEPYILTKRELKNNSLFNIIKNKLIIIDTLKMQSTMMFNLEDIRKRLEISKDKIFIIVVSDNDRFPDNYLSDVCIWNMKIGVPSIDEKRKYIEGILKQNKLSISSNSNYIDTLAQKDMEVIDTELLQIIIDCKTKGNSTISTDVKGTLKTATNKPNRKTGLEELEDMIGLEAVKNQIKQIINYIRLNKKRGQPPLLHFAFVGPSGSGKTEVSKILGRVFAEENILSDKNLFIQGTRCDLVAGYVGQTGAKTRDFLNQAKGRSCFIR